MTADAIAGKASGSAAATLLEHRQLEVYCAPIESPDSVFGYAYRVRMLLHPSDTVAPLERPNRTVRVGRLFVV